MFALHRCQLVAVNFLFYSVARCCLSHHPNPTNTLQCTLAHTHTHARTQAYSETSWAQLQLQNSLETLPVHLNILSPPRSGIAVNSAYLSPLICPHTHTHTCSCTYWLLPVLFFSLSGLILLSRCSCQKSSPASATVQKSPKQLQLPLASASQSASLLSPLP